jgi:hypothetical protein
MSIFRTVEAACPSCGTPVEFELVFSVSADRRPDLREAILDGSFQRRECAACGTSFRADPEFVYMDIGRRQYIGVWPESQRAAWRECAERTREVFDETLGAGATAEAREVGEGLEGRVVFGWAALVEKILARQAGIDDRTLEVAKALLMRDAEDEIRVPGADEYRLIRLDGDDFVFAWVHTENDTASHAVRVPRTLFAEIEAVPAKWAGLRDSVAEGMVVDLQREMFEE